MLYIHIVQASYIYVDRTRVRLRTHACLQLRAHALSKKNVVTCNIIHCVFFFPAILLIASCIKIHNLQSREFRIQNLTYGNGGPRPKK